ncbi:transformation/transcription domain-associated protein [Nematocida sp. LUAm3]|nr:transformation/transcription domain-associated protein [Nematocida sp. LUAm3]
MKIKDMKRKDTKIPEGIEEMYKWRSTEEFLEYIQEEKSLANEVFPRIEKALTSSSPEEKQKAMSVLLRIKNRNIPQEIVELIVAAVEEGSLTSVSLGVRCLIDISKKMIITPEMVKKVISAIDTFFKRVNLHLNDPNSITEARKAILLSSEPVILLLVLIQIQKEEIASSCVSLCHTLKEFCSFFLKDTNSLSNYLINENIKLQCITTQTQITSLFIHLLKQEENHEIQQASSFLPELTIFLLGFCPDDAVSIKKDIYHQLSTLKSEKKRAFSSYSEIILKEGILLRPKNPVLKLLGLTLSTELLIIFRDTTHRHLSLKVCREAAKILSESNDHTLNKLCANVLVQINDTIIGDNISLGEKGYFIRMNYLVFLSAFKKYSKMKISEEIKNVLRSVIRGMKNTMHYFSLFQNIPSNAIVFSLKCFTPLEISEFSLNLGSALSLFTRFNLEKRNDIIIVCEFLLIFFYLDASLFQRVLEDNIKLLFSLTKENKSMFTIWRQFLAYAGVAHKFASIVMDELLGIIHEQKEKTFILLGFKEIFSSFAVHTSEIETVVACRLTKLFEKTLMVEQRVIYTLNIVKELFSATGAVKLDLLHKEISLNLPLFFERIDKISRAHPNALEWVELVLLLPVKISILLPFLGQMSDSLIIALKMKNSLSVTGMEMLETCIDNLNSDFLLTYLGESIDRIFTALIDLIHHEECSVMAIKLLGKLSGKVSNSYCSPDIRDTSSLHVLSNITGYSDTIKIPVDDLFLSAAKVLRGELPGSKEDAVSLTGHFFSSFFSWDHLTEEILSNWASGVDRVMLSDFEELHKKVYSAEIHLNIPEHEENISPASMKIAKELISSLFSCAAHATHHLPHAIHRTVHAVPYGPQETAETPQETPQETAEIGHTAQMAKDLLHTIYSFLSIVKVLELINYEEFQKRINADITVLIDGLVEAFGAEESEEVAQSILAMMYDLSQKACGTKEKTSQMTLFYTILHSFCAACYGYSDKEKKCGINGLIYMTHTMEIGKSWLLFQEIRIINALFASLITEKYNNTEVVRETICHILRTTHDPSTESLPVSSEHFTQLLLCFAQELSHPNVKIRRVCQECLEYSAELYGSDAASFLLPIKEKVLTQVLSKPLRALSQGVQVGNMDVITYLLSLRPPLIGNDERIERFIGEAFRIVSSSNSTLPLRVTAVRLFVSAATSPDFTSSSFLLKISQVLIKGLFSKEKEIVEICKEGLRQMYIQGKETPKEILQTWLVPVVNSFSQKKVTIQIIQGISYLQELNSNIFKHGLAINLLDMLNSGPIEGYAEESVNICFKMFAKAEVPQESEFISNAISLYIRLFKSSLTRKVSLGFQEFLECKPRSLPFLFRISNDDDSSYYILLDSIRNNHLLHKHLLSSLITNQSTWRHYVIVAEVKGISRAEGERALEIWRDGIGDTHFEDMIRKWSTSSESSLMAYYSVEENRTLPIRPYKEETETQKKSVTLFLSILSSGEIFSLPEKVQLRMLYTFMEDVPDKEILCVSTTTHWIAHVSALLIRYVERPSERIIAYLKDALLAPETEPADSIKIITYLIRHEEHPSSEAFIHLITAHPEYSEDAIRGISLLLEKKGVSLYIEAITSALNDETLYKTHTHIIYPLIARVPHLFTRTGIEPSAGSAAIEALSSGNSKLGVLLFKASVLWYNLGTLSPFLLSHICSAYITYYIRSKTEQNPEDISSLPFAPHLVDLSQKVSPRAVALLYAASSSSLSHVLRPALRICLQKEEEIKNLQEFIELIGKADRTYLEELFSSLEENIPPRTGIICAYVLKTRNTVERALLIVEEMLKIGNMAILPEILPKALELATDSSFSFALPLLAHLIVKYPSLLRNPEIPEVLPEIIQSHEVLWPLKYSLLLAMNTEDMQEIGLGLVYNLYVEQLHTRRETLSGLQALFIRGLDSSSEKLRYDFFSLFDQAISSSPSERLIYLFSFEWEMFQNGRWIPSFTRMLASLLTFSNLLHERFWKIEKEKLIDNVPSEVSQNIIFDLKNSVKKYKNLSKTKIKDSLLSLLYSSEIASKIILKTILVNLSDTLQDAVKEVIHHKAEEMLCRLGKKKLPGISSSSEAIILGILPMCLSNTPCSILQVAKATGAWTPSIDSLNEGKSSSFIYREIGEEDFLLAQLRLSALYPESIRALMYQQIGEIHKAQLEYEGIQAKAQSGVVLFNEEEYTIWEEQWIECATQLQQWDLLSEIGAATKNNSLTAKSKWYTTEFSIDSEKTSFKRLIEELPQEKAFYELFIVGEKTKETEDTLFRIVSHTIEEISSFPSLSPRQMQAVERFQIVVEMNESWQLNESEDIRRDLTGVLLAWKERVPFEWAPLSFWSMLIRWRTHIFSSLWNSRTKEKALQYRGYHETANALNRFSKALRRHGAYSAALTNLENIYTLPNIEISDAYMKLEEHTKCYIKMKEYSAGLELLGMTNLNYFTPVQKSGIFLLRAQLLEKKNLPEEASKVYAQAAQVHPTNGKVWYRWGMLTLKSGETKGSSGANAVNAFLQAAAISPGQIARKSLISILSLMDEENDEMEKVFESMAAEIDAWCFIPFILQMVAILSRTGSPMALSALTRVAKIYPQAVYFPIRNALEIERKKGIEEGPISDLWTYLKTGFTLMCINIEGIVETLTLRLRCTGEEEFYRLICALLSEALQQLFGKEALENGSLVLAIRKISEMIEMSSLSGKYKKSFDKDFNMILHSDSEESPHTQQVWRISQILLKWKGALEKVLGSMPKRLSMENISRRMVDFDQKNEDIEMFGQYIEITDRAKQMVKISRFETEITIKRRNGISLRKLKIRGHNGQIQKVSLQMPSGKSVQREERFIHSLALINASIERNVQIKKRNIKVPIKKIVSLNKQTRIIVEEEEEECLGELLEKYLGGQGVYRFLSKCREMIQSAPDLFEQADALDPEKRLKMFLEGSKRVPDDLLLSSFSPLFNCHSDLFYFKKRVAISHGMHSLISYVFSIGSRMPSRLYIGKQSGSMLSSEFYPSFSEKQMLEEVPFRLTPNLQRLIGRVGLEGPFLSAMYHGASLLSKKTYLITYIETLAKEEIGEEKAKRAMSVIREKIKELSICDTLPAKGIIRLIGNSTAPERLSMMDPQWHPWF